MFVVVVVVVNDGVDGVAVVVLIVRWTRTFTRTGT